MLLAVGYSMAWAVPLLLAVGGLVLLCTIVDIVAAQRWQSFLHNCRRIRELLAQHKDRRADKSKRRDTLRDVHAQGDRLPEFILTRLMPPAQNPPSSQDSPQSDTQRHANTHAGTATRKHTGASAEDTAGAASQPGGRDTAAYFRQRPNPLQGQHPLPVSDKTDTFRIARRTQEPFTGQATGVVNRKRRVVPWAARRTLDAQRFLKKLPRRGWRWLRRRGRTILKKIRKGQ